METAPVGGVEQVSVREPGRHAEADELEDAAEDRQLVHGIDDARSRPDGDKPANKSGVSVLEGRSSMPLRTCCICHPLKLSRDQSNVQTNSMRCKERRMRRTRRC